jgi:2-keto-4-pentenoate hydratase
MGRDLPPRERPYTRDEILDAVASLHAAIEIPDSRFLDYTQVGAENLIADNACGLFFTCGPANDVNWRRLDLVGLQVTGQVDGKIERQGSGANVLGDPAVALTWLVNEVSALGQPIRAGQYVSTGACVPPLEIAPGDSVTADFGPIGVVRVHFEE